MSRIALFLFNCYIIAYFAEANCFKIHTHSPRFLYFTRNIERFSPSRFVTDDSEGSGGILVQNEDSKESPVPELPLQDDPSISATKNKFLIDKSIIYTVPQDDYIVVGQILTVYGLKGHVKVKSYSNQPQIRLCEPGYRYLKIPYNDEKVIPIKLERGRSSGSKDVYIVKFEGFDSVEQSQRLANAYVTIPLVDVPPLEENTYYSRDILGLDLYLYNDVNKTKLGKIVGFVHRSDLACKKKYEEICDDLIEVQIDMKLSLQTLMDVANAAKTNKEQETEQDIKPPTIITERDLEEADEVIDMYEEFERPNFKSLLYVKYYECSTCGREFTDHTEALLHEKKHEDKPNSMDVETPRGEDEQPEDDPNKTRVVAIEDIITDKRAPPIRRFYVPLIRDETVKYIDVQNKSVYVDPYTIFIGEDPNYK